MPVGPAGESAQTTAGGQWRHDGRAGGQRHVLLSHSAIQTAVA